MDVNPVAENMRLADNYVRHMKELKQASNYLKNKKKKSEFENIAYRNIGSFYSEAVNAVRKMSDDKLKNVFCRHSLAVNLYMATIHIIMYVFAEALYLSRILRSAAMNVR